MQNGTNLKIGAVMVTYHPDSAVFGNILKLAEQVNELIIVDNGSPEDFWMQLGEKYPEVKFKKITNPKNLGIATAFNLGARALLDSGFDFVMTFDQVPKFLFDYLHSEISSVCAIDFTLSEEDDNHTNVKISRKPSSSLNFGCDTVMSGKFLKKWSHLYVR